MKKIIFVLTLILTGGLFASAQTPEKKTTEKSNSQVIEREKFDPTKDAARDLQAAIAKAQTEGKRIILDVGGEWCGWCRLMDNYFIKNPALAKLRDENFVWLKINFSEENENKEFLAAYPAIKGYPHLFVLEKDGKLLHSQNTEELEEPKSYNLQKFTDFLKLWSPPKTSVK
ncbi:MAG: thioredoxin family protein [Acidobacteria bacterium]|jgi:thiol:disulfide interchange protein|nr:thioredoxin family protein [Acidobacteriota bacterium]